MKCSVVRIPTGSPGDVSALRAAVEDGSIDPRDVVAVLGKTEGNGCVNDFTRGYAVRVLSDFFASRIGEDASRISYVMSGGTEGVLSPHLTVISRKSGAAAGAPATGAKSLAIGVRHTRDFLPEEIGRTAQIEAVADAVREAIAEAGIASAADVHFVQIKCPLLTTDAVREAKARGVQVATEDTYKSMGLSRGASALGAAAALGEIDGAALTDEDVCHAWEKYSEVASTSAGSELSCCEVIVFGNSAESEGPFFIDHGVMKDAIDGDALRRLLDAHPGAELVQVLAKAEADPDGVVRGRRHTMLNDSDINHTRHARAVVGGVLAYVSGDPMIYVSGGAEHQGPAGGGSVAAIFKRTE
ncbi:ring-opening amidohydrolase [Paenibacillus sp.]|uniref:cyanuric acid amidohydrolase n=1 Tax=Paenibacillus sp. TaxID=58172 RepID=UPI002D4DF986|nr:ring-opening amidohydrolase [Paenibacillus sp.]HZG84271.1 ring-opening amidohydrolase [Paenibacillus sp.]